MTRGVLLRLQDIEDKVNACLVMLRTVVTADDFVYTVRSDRYPGLTKPERWREEMDWAMRLASRVLIDGEEARLNNGLKVSICPSLWPVQDKSPTDKEAATQSQELRRRKPRGPKPKRRKS